MLSDRKCFKNSQQIKTNLKLLSDFKRRKNGQYGCEEDID
jgi:hypothetical protein